MSNSCTGVHANCGPSTVKWKSYADYCYHTSDQTHDFDASKTACEELGATLTSIPGKMEALFMLDG